MYGTSGLNISVFRCVGVQYNYNVLQVQYIHDVKDEIENSTIVLFIFQTKQTIFCTKL